MEVLAEDSQDFHENLSSPSLIEHCSASSEKHVGQENLKTKSRYQDRFRPSEPLRMAPRTKRGKRVALVEHCWEKLADERAKHGPRVNRSRPKWIVRMEWTAGRQRRRQGTALGSCTARTTTKNGHWSPDEWESALPHGADPTGVTVSLPTCINLKGCALNSTRTTGIISLSLQGLRVQWPNTHCPSKKTESVCDCH